MTSLSRIQTPETTTTDGPDCARDALLGLVPQDTGTRYRPVFMDDFTFTPLGRDASDFLLTIATGQGRTVTYTKHLLDVVLAMMADVEGWGLRILVPDARRPMLVVRDRARQGMKVACICPCIGPDEPEFEGDEGRGWSKNAWLGKMVIQQSSGHWSVHELVGEIPMQEERL